ncbi:ras-related and estrogen-regulated growth inhibitor-like protein [Watersipora subatra]|uniref:ras-related and estrogen-regulated growth inhibitor-like protein n=1 Tax=Watersipora subatra TaxID=2589382 RepID=UPI00355C5320
MSTIGNYTMSASIIRKEKRFKVAIIGASCVGKSALTVRLKTRKYIHNYAPNLESRCAYTTLIDGEQVNIELVDTAALQTAENANLKERIKWADAFILLYSVTDQSSLAALLAAKFLLNLYAKRRRITSTGNSVPDLVALVGNKCDLEHERMISEEDGRLSAEINNCTHFFELSVRESYEGVKAVVDSLYKSFLIKPSRPSLSLPSKTATLPMEIPKEESEEALMHAAKRKERSAAALNIFPGNDPSSKTSPVTFKKILGECSICLPSPDMDKDEIHFVGEQIIEQIIDSSSDSLPAQRRITVCGSPALSRRPSKFRSRSKQGRSTVRTSDANNNQE